MEKLSFYLATSLLALTIAAFIFFHSNAEIIGYFSILWGLFILHRLFFMVAPKLWRQNLDKKLSVRLDGIINITSDNIKSALIWRVIQWDVLLFVALIFFSVVYLIFNDFIMSPNKQSLMSKDNSSPDTLKLEAFLYDISTYISIFSIYLCVLFSFFSFSRSISTKKTIDWIYFVIFILFIGNLIFYPPISINIVLISLLILTFFPLVWTFLASLWFPNNGRTKALLDVILLLILLLNLSYVYDIYLGDVVTLLCLPVIGFQWANMRQTPFDRP